MAIFKRKGNRIMKSSPDLAVKVMITHTKVKSTQVLHTVSEKSHGVEFRVNSPNDRNSLEFLEHSLLSWGVLNS